MTKKDYKLITEALRSAILHFDPCSIAERKVIEEIEERLIISLQSENPRFDVEAFRDAVWSL